MIRRKPQTIWLLILVNAMVLLTVAALGYMVVAEAFAGDCEDACEEVCDDECGDECAEECGCIHCVVTAMTVVPVVSGPSVATDIPAGSISLESQDAGPDWVTAIDHPPQLLC